jgi:hypothetical protein
VRKDVDDPVHPSFEPGARIRQGTSSSAIPGCLWETSSFWGSRRSNFVSIRNSPTLAKSA